MKSVNKYYVTFRDGEHFGTYAVAYAENEEKAFAIAAKEFGNINVSNVYTEYKWKYKYTGHLKFLKEVNGDYYKTYLGQCSKYQKRKKGIL